MGEGVEERAQNYREQGTWLTQFGKGLVWGGRVYCGEGVITVSILKQWDVPVTDFLPFETAALVTHWLPSRPCEH